MSDTCEVPLMVACADTLGQRCSIGTRRKVPRWVEIWTELRLLGEGFQDRGLTGTVLSSRISLALWQMKTTRKQRDSLIPMHFWSAEGPDPCMVQGHEQVLPLPCHLWRQKDSHFYKPLNAHIASGIQFQPLFLLASPIAVLTAWDLSSLHSTLYYSFDRPWTVTMRRRGQPSSAPSGAV